MTRCHDCGSWCNERARIANGEGWVPVCRTCAEKLGAWKPQYIQRDRHIGPAPKSAQCTCGARAVANCQGCNHDFCERHWWKHSHTSNRRAA